MALHSTLMSITVSVSMLMASAGYLARSFGSEPVRPNIVSHSGRATHNWYQAKQTRRTAELSSDDKSALTMRISALTNERMK